jgi:Na+-driven multidrug efflux pump
MATLAAMVVFALPGTLLRMFTTDPDLLAVGVPMARTLAIGIPAMGSHMIAPAFYQARGMAIPAVVLAMIRYIVLIPLMVVLGRFLAVQGVLIAVPISDAAAMVIAGLLLIAPLTALRRADAVA